MMSGNPNWWGTMNNTMHLQSQHQHSPQFAYVCNSPLSSPNQLTSSADHHLHSNGEEFPVRSWSQLLLGGLGHNEEERFGDGVFQQHRKMENWEEQVMLNLNNDPSCLAAGLKRAEVSRPDSQFYGGFGPGIDANRLPNFWPDTARRHQVVPPSSPASCVTTLSGHVLNFSGGAKSKTQAHARDPSPHECNSTGDGGASKKVRLSQPSAQQPLKVRKEKLGDKISALHQLVSPFGKTDTASVLSEAIGYIRFLHEQIETLSSPYMRNASAEGSSQQADYVQEKNCFLPTEPDMGLEGRHEVVDLRSMGICLVPIECTQHVGSESGADYWAQAAFGGEF